jgi:hypothetical protein
MEVHHHSQTTDPDMHRGRKKWSHYLWEFLMLFLAVFCGFLAENQREHIVEHQRERQFIYSICLDLKFDTSNLNSSINFRNKSLVFIDSLLYFLKMPDPDKYGKYIYYYARSLTGQSVFLSNDRTIQQLKNAGNLRLIRNQPASDSIMSYDWEIRRNEFRMEREAGFIKEYIAVLKELFDGNEFDKMAYSTSAPFYLRWSLPDDDPHLLYKNKESIQKLVNSLHFLKSINIFIVGWNEDRINQASSLIEFLKKEYNLKINAN